jgi:hypothetical protein
MMGEVCVVCAVRCDAFEKKERTCAGLWGRQERTTIKLAESEDRWAWVQLNAANVVKYKQNRRRTKAE